ncbi:predicted protein [Uncinocarpus reesii 1704]|uniref:Uncharacterized protein n=1 Tax=Uncinocarpus reesii (strain UAMH 1704) TaxID=336963 RepID=C4JP62_UNCRE|nr:uncharacterized protein UREG_03121 [Uncinocarpus reesii 1704]EEP78276.1 predicted protein [Uncinocarpus reesii 1704]
MDPLNQLKDILHGHGLDNQVAIEDLWRLFESIPQARTQSQPNTVPQQESGSHRSAAPRRQRFIAGHTLRFTPEYARIRVNPSKGWDFSGPSGPAPPPRPAEHHAAPLKVGISIDGLAPLSVVPSGTGTVIQFNNANEPVYLHLTVEAPGYQLRDSLGRIVFNQYVRFDPQYNSENALLQAAQLQRAEELEVNTQLWNEFTVQMRNWRIAHRNLAIFPPDITRAKLQAAFEHLLRENERDRAGWIEPDCIGRPFPTSMDPLPTVPQSQSQRPRSAHSTTERAPVPEARNPR